MQLQYTRGSIIPCSLLFSSQDTQALDLISLPEAAILRLIRVVDFALGRRGTWGAADIWANGFSSDGHPIYRQITYIQKAAWWRRSSLTDVHDPCPRRLYGEVHLRPNLTPPVHTPDMKIYVRRYCPFCRTHLTVQQYKCILFPFEAPGIALSNVRKKVLYVQDIDIVTAYGHGSGSRPVNATAPNWDRPSVCSP
jgi:hypothetical protein